MSEVHFQIAFLVARFHSSNITNVVFILQTDTHIFQHICLSVLLRMLQRLLFSTLRTNCT